jgi:hypothetical protein
MNMPKLDEESQEMLDRRIAIGDRCIVIAANGLDDESYYLDDEDDRRTYACDAVSDILSALFGAAGSFTPDGKPQYDWDQIGAARNFLDSALRSYEGDAEDYSTE